MIYKLRKKFIIIAAISMTIVFAAVLLGTYFFSSAQMNSVMDKYTQLINDNNNFFPKFDGQRDFGGAEKREYEDDHKPPEEDYDMGGFITPETQFSTRYFSVQVLFSGSYVTELKSIAAVDAESAKEYADFALRTGAHTGWVDTFYFHIYDYSTGKNIVFVDGSSQIATNNMTMGILIIIELFSFVLVFLLIFLLSKRAVKPIAESYQKQKRFITDANHELKTPLTLILSNIDIIEAEHGKSEWIDDMRTEGQNMTKLINQLVELSRMDEENVQIKRERINMSELVENEILRFETAAREKDFGFSTEIKKNLFVNADINTMTRLVGILLENALKYCDSHGDISVSLTKHRAVELRVENTFAKLDKSELDCLFERFYRSDKARTSGSGTGIGLSIAAAIAEANNARIRAYEAQEGRIGFLLTLK